MIVWSGASFEHVEVKKKVPARPRNPSSFGLEERMKSVLWP